MAKNSTEVQAQIDGVKAKKNGRLQHKKRMRKHQRAYVAAGPERASAIMRAQVPAIIASMDLS